MSRRDDFSKNVKETIAARVNHRCSNPVCGASTSGPQLDHDKALNIGVAAHITAAAEGGPRFVTSMSKFERRSTRNGIWLCQNCAKLVDNDERRFTADMLKNWKSAAEDQAKSQIGRPLLFDRLNKPDFNLIRDASGIDFSGGIADELNFASMNNGIARCLSECNENCSRIEILDRGVGLSGATYAIVGTSADDGWSWKVIFMTVGEFGWHIVGRVILASQKGCVPRASYVPGMPGAVVLEHLNGYGTGVHFVAVSWYRIAPDQIKPIISYPKKFYVNGWDMPFDRYIESETLSSPARLSSGQLLISRFDIRYEIARSESDSFVAEQLFSDEIYLALEWNDEAGVFMPRTSADDFSILDRLWAEGTQGFVKRNASRLKQLAYTGNSRQKAFAEQQLSLYGLVL